MMRRLLVLLLFLPRLAWADDLDVAIENEMRQEAVPGLTFAVVRNGEIRSPVGFWATS
jgi:hypothetical protein